MIQKSYGVIKSKHNGYRPSPTEVSYSSKFQPGAFLDLSVEAINSIQLTDLNCPYFIESSEENVKYDENKQNEPIE
jgi:hypothetical protein